MDAIILGRYPTALRWYQYGGSIESVSNSRRYNSRVECLADLEKPTTSTDQRREGQRNGAGRGGALNFTVISHYVFRAQMPRLCNASQSSYVHEERSGVDLFFGFRPSSLRNDDVHLERVRPGAFCSSASLQLSDSLIFLLLPLLLLVLLPPFS